MKNIKGSVISSEDSGSEASTVLAPRSRENTPDPSSDGARSICESTDPSTSAYMNRESGAKLDRAAAYDINDVQEDPLKISADDCNSDSGSTFEPCLQRPVITVRKSEALFGVGNIGKMEGSTSSDERGIQVKPQDGYYSAVEAPIASPIPSFARTRHLIKQKEGNSQKMLGTEVSMSPVGLSLPLPQLPPDIQVSKKTMPPTQVCSKTKARKELSGVNKVKMPDTISLATRNARRSVTDALAKRGVTMISSRKTPLHRTRSTQKSMLPTVDLTKETESPPRRLQNKNIAGGRWTCEICDKAFLSQTNLSAHMSLHRGSRLECRDCSATYGTEAALRSHRTRYHAAEPSPFLGDMAIPVVDLNQSNVQQKLAQLGIRMVIPLAQLYSQNGSGVFGIPVVALDAATNPAICNISGIGASNLLPIGPLKSIAASNRSGQ